MIFKNEINSDISKPKYHANSYQNIIFNDIILLRGNCNILAEKETEFSGIFFYVPSSNFKVYHLQIEWN